ncbi:MAG: hypothetical protein ACI814_004743 [Mariniblastus sp.]|jgi:hypothetical protein
MTPPVLASCWPWIGWVVVSVVAARLLVVLSGAKLSLARLRSIHHSQDGSVQSLSFVLTLPFFVMILMMIIQASHVMIGNIVVHYAAFASVRSASVWIPTNTSQFETTNRIGEISLLQTTGEGEQYLVYQIGDKFTKIQQAATLACTSLGPSRSLGYQLSSDGQATYFALTNHFAGLDPEANRSGLIDQRLYNKLAYSMSNTSVRLTFWHRNTLLANRYRDPPLQVRYGDPPFIDEFYPNEVGWQDELTAQVTYNLPLLPGPLRFFAPKVEGEVIDATESGSPNVDSTGNTFVWPIHASATMGIEGEKPLIAFWQEEFNE